MASLIRRFFTYNNNNNNNNKPPLNGGIKDEWGSSHPGNEFDLSGNNVKEQLRREKLQQQSRHYNQKTIDEDKLYIEMNKCEIHVAQKYKELLTLSKERTKIIKAFEESTGITVGKNDNFAALVAACDTETTGDELKLTNQSDAIENLNVRITFARTKYDQLRLRKNATVQKLSAWKAAKGRNLYKESLDIRADVDHIRSGVTEQHKIQKNGRRWMKELQANGIGKHKQFADNIHILNGKTNKISPFLQEEEEEEDDEEEEEEEDDEEEVNDTHNRTRHMMAMSNKHKKKKKKKHPQYVNQMV